MRVVSSTTRRWRKTQGEKLRAESDAFSGVVVAHNKRCMPMVYRLEDRDAILKELRARKT